MSKFPMYQMVVNGETRYYDLGEAGRLYDSGHLPVGFGELVMEEDTTERAMTDDDKRRISNYADKFSASK